MNYGLVAHWGRQHVELSFSDGSLIRLSPKQSVEFTDWVSIVLQREVQRALDVVSPQHKAVVTNDEQTQGGLQ